jgi:hypothetical protein
MKKTHLSPSLFSTALVLAAAATAGCGSAPPPPQAPPPVHEEPHQARPKLRVSGELGSVDPGAVKDAFGKLDDKFMNCQKQGLDRVEVLAGSVKFFLRIGEDGTAKWTYFEESDLGDRDTEKCLLDAVMAAQWPKPDGGDAEARYTMEFPAQGRPATDWSSDKVAAALGKHGDAVDACKEGSSAKFAATMYVGHGGKVLAAGVQTSSRDGADKCDCIADALKKLKGLPSPGSWPAKVSFGL